ncbi:MAG: protein kinase [Candidatus Paceibacterota bacterium]
MEEINNFNTTKYFDPNKDKINDDFENKVHQFLKENELDLDIPERKENVQILAESENKEIVSDFVIANDFKIANNIILSYKEGGNKLLVVKKTPEEKIREFSQLNHWGDLTVEEYLKEKKFSSPDIILPIETIKRDGTVYRFYEALDMDLDQYIEKYGKLPLETALSICIRTCNSLNKLHEIKVVHADFLLANIVFKDNIPKLIDFDNSVKNPSLDGKYRRDYIGGNRFSMAPELLEERPVFDKTVDIYAASAILYKLIEGHWPYNIEEQTRGMPFEEKIAEYKKIHQSGQINFSDLTPNNIRIIIKKGMESDPKERYQDIKEFILDLLNFYNSEK